MQEVVAEAAVDHVVAADSIQVASIGRLLQLARDATIRAGEAGTELDACRTRFGVEQPVERLGQPVAAGLDQAVVAEDAVLAGAAVDAVVAGAAVEVVVLALAEEHVVADHAVDRVVAGLAVDQVGGAEVVGAAARRVVEERERPRDEPQRAGVGVVVERAGTPCDDADGSIADVPTRR